MAEDISFPVENASAILARFAANLNIGMIPENVRRASCSAMLDGLGVAIAAGTAQFAHQTAAALVAVGASGDTPAIGMGLRLQPRDAAFLNGILVHGLDFDDTHLRSAVHATASLLPTLFALGHARRASGAEMVTAYVAGLEAVARLGIFGGIHLREAGFHTTSVLGIFGCAIASGKLMGLDEDRLRMAQGIALSMASGRIGSAADGASNKRLHPGWAAQGGIMAAALAEAGVRGPDRPYEGVQGLFTAMRRGHDAADPADCDPAAAMADLGVQWESLNISVKPIPACHLTHACSDAAATIARAHRVDPAAVTRIVAIVPEPIIPIVCEPIELKRAPATSYEAQFSIPYVVAASFARGRFSFTELDAASLADPVIRRLASCVVYEIDPASTYPRHRSGEVRVELADGRTLCHREAINRGAPERPLSDAEIEAKFRGNVAARMADAQTDATLERMRAMAEWPDAGQEIERLCMIGAEAI
jgi:2-methylcitrate dehydratase PrpD